MLIHALIRRFFESYRPGFFINGGGAAVATYEIAKSLRFRSANSAYLSRTPGTAGNSKLLCRRYRIKRGKLGVLQVIESAGTANIDRFYFDASNRLCLDILGVTRLVTTQAFRDVAGHYVDIGFELDVANGTASSRAKILVNGVEVNSYSTDTRASIVGSNTNWNAAVVHYIGRDNSGNYFDGYLSEPVGLDGSTAIQYSAFDNITNSFVPKRPSGSYGVNGFFLDFADGTNLTSLGQDRSGNGNNWACNGISLTSGVTYDWMDDTPTNNFAVLNPLDVSLAVATISNGNLTHTGIAGNRWSHSSVAINSGSYYVECLLGGGIGSGGYSVMITSGATYQFMYNGFDGYVSVNGTKVTNVAASTTNDVLALAFNRDSATCALYKNNTLLYTATGLTAGDSTFEFFTGNAGTMNINFGQRPFAYTPPTGFKALCTKNLPEGTITTSGSFTGNLSADGPSINLNGVPLAMTINGNSVIWGTHADKTAYGFKVRTSSSSYNASGTNTYSVTSTGAKVKYATAQGNP